MLAVGLTMAATSHAGAEGLAVLPLRICQAPLGEEFEASRPTVSAERWTHASQAAMER